MHPPPVPPHKALSSRFKKPQPAAATPAPAPRAEVAKGPEVALELEFEQLWDAAEEERVGGEGGAKRRKGEGGGRQGEGRWELEEADRRAMREQAARCFAR